MSKKSNHRRSLNRAFATIMAFEKKRQSETSKAAIVIAIAQLHA